MDGRASVDATVVGAYALEWCWQKLVLERPGGVRVLRVHDMSVPLVDEDRVRLVFASKRVVPFDGVRWFVDGCYRPVYVRDDAWDDDLDAVLKRDPPGELCNAVEVEVPVLVTLEQERPEVRVEDEYCGFFLGSGEHDGREVVLESACKSIDDVARDGLIWSQ